MDDDEVLLLALAGLGSLWGLVLWKTFLNGTNPFRPRIHLRLIPAIVCATGLGMLFWALRSWADDDVRDNAVYLFLLMGFGFALQAIVVFRIAPWFGLIVTDDLAARNNSAAVCAFVGLLLGIAICFAGANIGEGPSLWNNVFSAGLSIGGLLAMWSLVQWIGNSAILISEERDLASGVRIGGFFLSAGVVLGRALAGNWVSATDAVQDLFRLGWPAGLLAIVAGLFDRACRPKPADRFPDWRIYGLLPAALYAGVAASSVGLAGSWTSK